MDNLYSIEIDAAFDRNNRNPNLPRGEPSVDRVTFP